MALTLIISGVAHASPAVLSPENGGASILPEVLKPGDILLTTTKSPASFGIQVATSAPVSHAILYLGTVNGKKHQVVEANVKDGVAMRPLGEAIKDATLAVAFRHPDLGAKRFRKLLEFVLIHAMGKKYNKIGVVVDFLCRKKGLDSQCTVAIENTLRKERRSRRSFYCSQLVDDAFRAAKIDLTPKTSAFPDDFRVISFVGELLYVGHLR